LASLEWVGREELAGVVGAVGAVEAEASGERAADDEAAVVSVPVVNGAEADERSGSWVPPSLRKSMWCRSRKTWFLQPGTAQQPFCRRRTARRVAGGMVWRARWMSVAGSGDVITAAMPS
jgi:hypothetical protein